MSTITAKDLQRAADNAADAICRAGLIPEGGRIVFEEGSQTYGRAKRLHYSPQGSSGLYNIPGIDDYCGWTRAEAYQYLTGISQALSAVRRLAEGDEYMLQATGRSAS